MSQATATVIDFTAYRNAVLSGLPAPGPDSNYVATCEELIANITAFAELAGLAASKRAAAKARLDRGWHAAQDRIGALPLPTTKEGVRAAARYMVKYSAGGGSDDTLWATETWTAMSRACAEYLAGELA